MLDIARGKARSPLERNKVIALHELGRSVSQIVTQLGVPKQTCYDWIKSFRENNKVPGLRKGTVPPEKLHWQTSQQYLEKLGDFLAPQPARYEGNTRAFVTCP